MKALLVQTALIPEEKLSIAGSHPYSPLEQWVRTLEMLAPHLGRGNQLILFPEGAFPYGTNFPIYPVALVQEVWEYYFGSSEFLPQTTEPYVGNAFWAQALANYSGADVIIGLEDVDDQGRGYNAAHYFRPYLDEHERYEKRILVPMGEYIPFEWCKRILSQYGIMDSFVPGSGPKVLQGFGISICYEETYGELMRGNSLLGAQGLVNLTNDVWYPRSRLPIVHFAHGRLRALENGVPLLRACNTGVTAGVDALGNRVAMLPYDSRTEAAEAGVLALSLPLYHYSTLYSFFGDRGVIYPSIFLFGCFCMSVLIKRIQFIFKDLNIY
ncbi:MAG: apolipoprotein N-acyltransferase, partial [Chlamydiia bacterium]|nr:apolipoprotein N-acyltransferase [Chlamydiia bacterium]